MIETLITNPACPSHSMARKGKAREVNTVIDTSYSGSLTLPPALVAEFPYAFSSRVTLADDTELQYSKTVIRCIQKLML